MRRGSVLFTITEADIVIPEFCPVLGIRLERGTSGRFSASPSVDRYFPENGYAPGNVIVTSFRANCIKGNSTLEEMEKVLFVMETLERARNL